MSGLHRTALLFLLIVGLLLAGWTRGIARASTLQVLYAFPDTGDHNANRQGAYPFAAPVKGKDGCLYGVTYWGGKNGTGIVYKLSPAGVLTVLHPFAAQSRGDAPNADGAEPYGSLTIGPEGDLYGVASGGGATGAGVVFKITPRGKFTLLHVFKKPEGAHPCGALLRGQDGAFYGTTTEGGAYGNGTVYKITPEGALSVLHSLSKEEGAFALAGLTRGSDGAFYGTTGNGGANDTGTVFKITPSGVFTLLHTFPTVQRTQIHNIPVQVNSEGAHPFAGLVQARDGNLYGVTQFGGPYGSGVVFRVQSDGTFAVLHDFSLIGPGIIGQTGPNRDGAYPKAALVQAGNGRLYGVTAGGGTNGCGTIFSITPAGEFAIAHTFSRISPLPGNTNADGAQSRGIALADDGILYGTAFVGGSAGNGVIYRLEAGQDTLLPAHFDPSAVSSASAIARFKFVQAANGGTGSHSAGGFQMRWKTAAGDWLFAVIYLNKSSVTVTPPDAGWRSLGSIESGSGRMFAYYRPNAPAQSGMYTWKFHGEGPFYGGGVFEEFSVESPYWLSETGTGGSGTGRFIASGSVSDSSASGLLVCFGGIVGTGPSNLFSDPTNGFTLATGAQRADGSERAKQAIAGFLTYRFITRAGGPYSTSIRAASGTDYGAILGVFKP